MNKRLRFMTVLTALAGIAAVASVAFARTADHREINGTIWVPNRGADTIRGFDATTGEVVHTWAMAPGSQPGDLAFAKGKLYVSEEQGSAPALAIVDPESGTVLKRFFTGVGTRPHHVHASRSGQLVAFGLYGTDLVGVVDTRTDTLLGPWDTNKDTTNGRAHAGVFSPDGKTLYVASDATDQLIALDPRTGDVLWRLDVMHSHLRAPGGGRRGGLTSRAAWRWTFDHGSVSRYVRTAVVASTVSRSRSGTARRTRSSAAP
jgi:DNA-binding beta-propeller fold protein YncE